MRKWTVLIVYIIIFSSIYSISHASIEGIKLVNFPTNSDLYSMLEENQSKSEISEIIFLPEGSFDQKQAAQIINRLNHLPRPLLEKVQKEGIHVKLFTGKLTDNPTAKHLKGKVPRGYRSNATWDDVPGIGGSKTVLVKIGSSEQGMGHGSVNLELHELAHSIDRYVLFGLKNNSHFLEIWNDEKNALFPQRVYFLHFPEEYFAEAFSMYFLNQETRNNLKLKAPKTYNFIKNLDHL
ncbi:MULTISPECIES: toxin [unclassified Bacillus (in: firmicutes)]|uniref:anthrax toxin lethal factor-related metalloendopeptidase n=1 Tax=unclassified Bacillus (in: firmicutes) TaxID=185979 RepID=UPI0008E9BC64|nr:MULTISPECIES: toxin [unclassified Bacillus (in: firmicutes)]SFA92416.1 toxin lethal factor, N-and C-terminal domain [Bacillus sp. UNCCL13]SFQ85905.1 toxin lethal factor, N-and C-terminal domain [Bacillus sp. cl95]